MRVTRALVVHCNRRGRHTGLGVRHPSLHRRLRRRLRRLGDLCSRIRDPARARSSATVHGATPAPRESTTELLTCCLARHDSPAGALAISLDLSRIAPLAEGQSRCPGRGELAGRPAVDRAEDGVLAQAYVQRGALRGWRSCRHGRGTGTGSTGGVGRHSDPAPYNAPDY